MYPRCPPPFFHCLKQLLPAMVLMVGCLMSNACTGKAWSASPPRQSFDTPSFMGGRIWNFWQDAAHPRGIWRETTLVSYRSELPGWTTKLDLDSLAVMEKKTGSFVVVIVCDRKNATVWSHFLKVTERKRSCGNMTHFPACSSETDLNFQNPFSFQPGLTGMRSCSPATGTRRGMA